jgi:S-adenosylmethionine/arginine decarboxylase-like enzyme
MSDIHLHTLIRAKLKNAPTDTKQADEFLTTLVEKIKMNILMGPYNVKCETVGNEGFTGAVIIDTSHATFHHWEKEDGHLMMADVYSCKDYDPEVVVAHIKEYFGLNSVQYTVFDRSNGCHQLQMVDRLES